MNSKLKLILSLAVLALTALTLPVSAQDRTFLLKARGSVPWLGVSIRDLSKATAAEMRLPDENGVLVSRVEKDSPADKAGLQPNDVVVRFNGIEVLTVRQLTRMIQELLPNRRVDLGIIRGSIKKSFNVVLAERPGPSTPAMIGGDNHALHGLDTEPLRDHLQQLSDRFRDWNSPLTMDWFGPSHFTIGINLESLTPQLGEYFGISEGHGALIVSVREESLAEKAGMKAGDVITTIDSKQVNSPIDVIRLVGAKESGDLDIRVLRNHEPKSFKVHIEKPGVERRTSAHRVAMPRERSSGRAVI